MALAGFALPGGAEEIALPECSSVVQCASHSTVSVLPLWPRNAKRSEEPEGSGIAIADGHLIATADHVIGPARKVFIRTVAGQVRAAEIVLRDAETDIALLRIKDRLRPFEYSAQAGIGDKACAIGNGFGLDISVTCGVVSAAQMSGAGFNVVEDFVQTDAAVNPGMSGGALVDGSGRLIGMLSAIFTKKSDSNIGVNFAVSSQMLRRVAADFLDDGRLNRIQPGILVRPALQAGEEGVSGALVVRVKPASPEEKAGLQVGDKILFANDRRIKRAGAYRAALALLEKGNSLKLEVLREGTRKIITVRFD